MAGREGVDENVRGSGRRVALAFVGLLVLVAAVVGIGSVLVERWRESVGVRPIIIDITPQAALTTTVPGAAAVVTTTPAATPTVAPTATIATIVAPAALTTATSTPVATTQAAAPTATVAPPAVTPASITVYAANFATWFTGQETEPYPIRASVDPATDEYRLALTDPKGGYVYYRYAPEGQGFADFRLDVDARRIAGPDNATYGIIFRAQPQGPDGRTSPRYTFFIQPGGYFSLILTNADAGVTVVAPRTQSPLIKGGDATNRLTVICQGDRIVLGINDQIVGEYPATLTAAGAMGVYAGSPPGQATSSGMEAGFRNLRVSTVAAP